MYCSAMQDVDNFQSWWNTPYVHQFLMHSVMRFVTLNISVTLPRLHCRVLSVILLWYLSRVLCCRLEEKKPRLRSDSVWNLYWESAYSIRLWTSYTHFQEFLTVLFTRSDGRRHYMQTCSRHSTVHGVIWKGKKIRVSFYTMTCLTHHTKQAVS